MEEKYESIGKKYNGEKAIISLTSWKARIDTVGKTLFSLLKMCPGFHIVLVLSEEEFPQKEKELPDSLMLFIKKKFIEILWVYKNYKSFKKVLFTMDKYRDVPIISADDDCIYRFNYAEEWYNEWLKDKKYIICNAVGNKFGFKWGNGPYTLYPPYCFKQFGLCLLKDEILKTNNDDAYLGSLLTIMKIPTKSMYKKNIIQFHDNVLGLGDGPNRYNAEKDFKTIKKIFNDEFNRK